MARSDPCSAHLRQARLPAFARLLVPYNASSTLSGQNIKNTRRWRRFCTVNNDLSSHLCRTSLRLQQRATRRRATRQKLQDSPWRHQRQNRRVRYRRPTQRNTRS